MEIHGTDMTLEGRILSKEEIVAEVIKFWPNLVIDGYEEGFFIHKDIRSEKSWDEVGWSEENDLTMINVFYSIPKQHNYFIIDDLSKNSHIIEAIRKII